MTNKRYTFCRICEPHCPLVADTDDCGTITALSPDRDHPVGGIPCHKGLTFLDIHNDPDRLLWPMRRTNAKNANESRFERSNWSGAIADIAARLNALREEHGPHAIATYVGNPSAFNAQLIATLIPFMSGLGTRSTFSASTQDCTNKNSGAWALYGSSGSNPIPDIYNTDYLLCIGANPRVSHWTLVATPRDPDVLKRIRRRGGKLVFVNPRQIETSTEETGETLQIVPGTDVYFLAAILHEIEQRQGLMNPIVMQHGKNIEGLRTFVARYPAERVTSIVGIDADRIREVAADLLKAKSAAVYVSLGVNQSRQGLLCYWLAEMINLTTGNLGRRGGTSRPAGLVDRKSATQTMTTFDTSIASFDVFAPPTFPASLPATVLPDLIEAGDIKALIVLGGNPLLTVGGEHKLRAAFEKLDLLVMLDIFRNATCEYADYLLPTTDWLEREDIVLFSSGMQNIPYVQYTDALVTPAGERRTEAWILTRLSKAMGLPTALDPMEDEVLGSVLLDFFLGARGLSVDAMRRKPHQTVLFDDESPESFFERCLSHADGKIDCYPASFAEMGLIDRCDQIFNEHLAEAPGTLKLIMLRTPYMHNSWMANVPRLRHGKQGINPLHMCAADAAARGLHDGDMVEVRNNQGSVVTRLEIDEDLRTGVVAMSHGYGHARAAGMKIASTKPGVNYNQLVPTGLQAFEPISNMAWLTALPISVERYQPMTANAVSTAPELP